MESPCNDGRSIICLTLLPFIYADIESLHWTRNSRGAQLSIRMKDGAPSTTFQGFKEKDIDSLKEYAQRSLGLEVKELPMSTSGHNWGSLAIVNGSLLFNVGGKMALDVPLKDVTTAQQVRPTPSGYPPTPRHHPPRHPPPLGQTNPMLILPSTSSYCRQKMMWSWSCKVGTCGKPEIKPTLTTASPPLPSFALLSRRHCRTRPRCALGDDLPHPTRQWRLWFVC